MGFLFVILLCLLPHFRTECFSISCYLNIQDHLSLEFLILVYLTRYSDSVFWSHWHTLINREAKLFLRGRYLWNTERTSVIIVGFTYCYLCSFSCELGWVLQTFCPSHSIYTISMPNFSAGRWMSKYQSYCWECSGINWSPKCDTNQFFSLFFQHCILKL